MIMNPKQTYCHQKHIVEPYTHRKMRANVKQLPPNLDLLDLCVIHVQIAMFINTTIFIITCDFVSNNIHVFS